MNKTSNYFEIIVGTFVLVAAIWFFVSSAKNAKLTAKAHRYHVIAKFDNSDGISPGSDVKISGVNVGIVEDQSLDQQTFRAVLKMAIDDSVKLSSDSSAKISSEGLLGSKFLSLQPGSDENNLKDGDEIRFTQSSVSFEDLLGKFIFSSSSSKENKDEKKS
jgi:phospholipid/cholesterol/gamma-HCH transport system substrate-binding protein